MPHPVGAGSRLGTTTGQVDRDGFGLPEEHAAERRGLGGPGRSRVRYRGRFGRSPRASPPAWEARGGSHLRQLGGVLAGRRVGGSSPKERP